MPEPHIIYVTPKDLETALSHYETLLSGQNWDTASFEAVRDAALTLYASLQPNLLRVETKQDDSGFYARFIPDDVIEHESPGNIPQGHAVQTYRPAQYVQINIGNEYEANNVRFFELRESYDALVRQIWFPKTGICAALSEEEREILIFVGYALTEKMIQERDKKQLRSIIPVYLPTR